MPTHCTITCLEFRARRIDGVECGLFSIHAPLGQITLRVGRVSVQCTVGQGDCMCNCLCSCVVKCRMMMKGREKVKPGASSQPDLLEKHQGAARLNVPIRRTNRYQKYYKPSQHTYCGRVWNLIHACDVQSSDQKCTSQSRLALRLTIFKLKIYYPAGDRTPDLLNQRQTCYHLSPRGELQCKRNLSLKPSLSFPLTPSKF